MNRQAVRFALTIVTALSLALAGGTAAQWSGDPALNTRVSAAAGQQESPRLRADSLGRTTWVWRDTRAGLGDVYAQRLDARGFRLWGEHGASVCSEAHEQAAPRLAASGGSDIVVWEDARSDSGDIFAQALDAAGNPGWTAGGVAACAHAGRQWSPAVTADDSGGVIVAWLDRRDGANTSVYAQRLGPDGSPRWAAEGVAVCLAPGAHAAPAVVADANGGAFVLWADAGGGYRARRVGREGVVQWPAEGLPLCTQGSPRNLVAIPDGANGLLVSWDRTDGTGFFRDVVALRFDHEGMPQWPDTGVVLSGARLLQRYPALTSDGAGGAIVAWEDGRDFHLRQVYAQRVDAGGTPRWAADGVPLCSTDMTSPFPAIVPDGAGGAIVAWRDNRDLDVDVYAQRVDADGAVLWAVQGVPVSTAPDTQSAIVAAPDGAGGAILGWTDGRDPLTRADIHAARLLPNGTLDATAVAVPATQGGQRGTRLELVSPNPVRGIADFAFTLAQPGIAVLEVFDLRGGLVRTLASGPRDAGRHRAPWDLRDGSGRAVPNGVYYVRLLANGQRDGVRCVALR